MKTLEATALAVLLAGSAQAADLPEYQARSEAVDRREEVAIRTYAICREAIAESAAPYEPVQIETVLVGPVKRSTLTTRSAPLHVRITYETERGRQVRESSVDCKVARAGVVSITER